MSRIGNKPITIPAAVTATIEGRSVTVKGPRGELSLELPQGIEARMEKDCLHVARGAENKRTRAFHGLARSLAANMIEGVTRGFQRELELQGVGFRAAVQDRVLVLSLGYSHPIRFAVPATVEVAVKDSRIIVNGNDKQQVGAVAARIRSFYPPEPYQGKGVRYVGERVRRKAGKTVA